MPRGRKRQENKAQAIILRRPETVDKDTIAFTKDLGYNLMNAVDFVGWAPLQKKLFILALQGIDWQKSNNETIIAIDNKQAALQLGWDKSSETFRNIGSVMRREFDYMTKNSGLSMQNPRTGKWHTGNLIYDAYGDSLTTYVKLNPIFMCHLESLIETQALTHTPYLAMIGHDVVEFKSSFAEPLFMKLRYEWDNMNLEYKKVKFTTRELKDLFKMSEKDYMRDKDPETGKFTQFNRSAFEKKALIPAIEDINRGETMKILTWPSGKLFEKEKLNGKVHYYVLKYKVFPKDEIIERRQQVLKEYNERYSNIPVPTKEWLDSYDDNVIDASSVINN